MKRAQNRKTKRMFLNIDECARALEREKSYSCINLMTGEQLFITPKFLRKLLSGYAELLKQFDGFSIALISDDAAESMPNLSITVTENTHAIINRRGYEISAPLITREPSIIFALYSHFDYIWNTMPTIWYDKASVIARIEEVAASGEDILP